MTRAIHVITGSCQNACCTFTHAWPMQKDVNTINPNKIDVGCCFKPFAKMPQVYDKKCKLGLTSHYTLKQCVLKVIL